MEENKNEQKPNQKPKKGPKTKPDQGAEQKPDHKPKKKKSALHFAIEFFVKIAVTAIVITILVIFVVGIYVNHSTSSYPMLKDGDLCITNKLGTILRDDEIAYKKDEQIRFGRVVGMPGDVVDMDGEGNVYVNGEAL